MRKKSQPKPKPTAIKQVQTFEELLEAGRGGKPLESWNGMKILVMETKSGKVLLDVGSEIAHDPASMTKMLPFEMALEAIKAGTLKLDEKLTVPKSAYIEGTKVLVGNSYTVRELLGAMMTPSDNGATKMIVERLGLTVADLNKKAKELGLENSKFVSVHGLPVMQQHGPRDSMHKVYNSSTATDMAILIEKIHRDFPAQAEEFMGQASVKFANRLGKGDSVAAHHRLNDESSPLALPKGYHAQAKTGLTNAAGHNIAAVITAADKRELTVIVMGAERWPGKAVAIEAGVPTVMIKPGLTGNRMRDALVGDLVQEFMVKTAPVKQVAVAPAPAVAAPAQEKRPEVKPAPPVVAAPPAAAAKPASAASTPSDGLPHPSPAVLAAAVTAHTASSLPPTAMRAVEECRRTIDKYSRPGPEATAVVSKIPEQPTRLSEELQELAYAEKQLARAKKPKEKKRLAGVVNELKETIGVEQAFLKELHAIEDPSKPELYTKANYDAQIARAKIYLDAYVDGYDGALPPGGKAALKQKFHAIAEGAAGKETGWKPEIVQLGANRRPHTGVYQTAWPFIHDAAMEFDRNPAMQAMLERYPQDQKLLALSENLSAARGLPTTSFAGQGAAFAGMAVASFKQHLKTGGTAESFNGAILYQEHMMGGGAARRFREQLQLGPSVKGSPGVGNATYDGNYLVTNEPYAQLNDLNPQRITFAVATAADVDRMMKDKSIHARNKLVKTGAPAERVLAFEQAFLPEWTNNAKLKEQDIARVVYQKDLGLEIRNAAEGKLKDLTAELALKKKKPSEAQKDEILCGILKPMPPLKQPGGERTRG